MSALRDYQVKAVEGCFREWQDVQSTLVCLPTGAGKTRCASEIIKRFQPKRAIFLVHREELAFQSAQAIERDTDLDCQIEMADMVASTSLFHNSPVIVATIQTMVSGIKRRRMERFNPNDFGLLICDESHHSVAPSWKKVIEYFKTNKQLKVLNLTATPDRADEESLGQLIDSVAFDFPIVDAIDQGWLTPVEQQMVSVTDLDYSAVRTTAGDLNGSDLAAILEAEKTLQGMVGSAIQIIGDRRTIFFTVTVKQSEMACEIFNRYRPGMAGWVCGKTDKDDRRNIMSDFRNGRLQVLVNVGIVTEGVDVPEAEVCVMGRPTKSRSLYAQCVGRILRPLPGLVDGLSGEEERRSAIAESIKPVATVLDYVANSGRHKLISTADLLGGNVTEEAIELAIRKAIAAGGKPLRMKECLDEAEEEIVTQRELEKAASTEARRLAEARRLRLTAKVSFTKRSISPFDAFELTPVRERGWDSGKSLTSKQRAVLLKQGVDPDQLPYGQARQILNEQFRRWNEGLATMKQCSLLKRHGYETHDLKMADASKLIDALAKNGWRRPMEAA